MRMENWFNSIHQNRVPLSVQFLLSMAACFQTVVWKNNVKLTRLCYWELAKESQIRGRDGPQQGFISKKNRQTLVAMSVQWWLRVRLETTTICWNISLCNMGSNYRSVLYDTLNATNASHRASRSFTQGKYPAHGIITLKPHKWSEICYWTDKLWMKTDAVKCSLDTENLFWSTFVSH